MSLQNIFNYIFPKRNLLFVLALMISSFCFLKAAADDLTDSAAIERVKLKANAAVNCNAINWANWSNFTGRAATGTISNAGDVVNVTMTSDFDFGSTSTIYNYAGRLAQYPANIPNSTVPKTTWVEEYNQAQGTTNMCFSKTVTNPVLLFASLGSSNGTASKLTFDVPYVVLYDGGGMTFHDKYSLTGIEGYAVIMFPGDFNCVTIHSTTYEYYTNITWGLKPPPFQVNVTETGSTCGAVTLKADADAGAGATYQWDSGDTPTNATNTFHQSGTYVVTVTTADGCKSSVSKTITVPPGAEQVNVAGATTGCGSVTLTASGGTNYEWSGGDTPTSATNTFRTSGLYTLTWGSPPCRVNMTIRVTVNPAIVPTITEYDYCGKVLLVASGGDSYLWSSGGTNPNGASNYFTESGTYTVTVRNNATGCYAMAQKTITVTPAAAATISGNTTGCGSVTLTASGSSNYHWTGGDTPDAATNTFRQSGFYVLAWGSDLCAGSKEVIITVLPGITAAVTETANTCGSVTLRASGGGTYQWNGGDTPASATNTFHQSGTYTVTVFNADGCSATVTKTIVVVTQPAPVITGNTAGCGSVTLTASGGASYSWSGGDTPNSAINTFHQSGTYNVTATGAGGCTNSASVTVTVNPVVSPSISISALPAGGACAGSTVTYTANAQNAGNAAVYQWYKNGVAATTGTTYVLYNPANGDQISCTLSAVNPCAPLSAATSNTIVQQVEPSPAVSFTNGLELYADESGVLQPNVSNNVVAYAWLPASGLSSATVKNPVAHPQNTTRYTLTVTTAAGCTASASVTVTVRQDLIIYNTFTPNGDGVNDTWKIGHLNADDVLSVDIFNRYGTKVFHSVGYPKAWDGTAFNSKPVPAGVYFYIIRQSQQQQPLKGYVTVLR